MSGDVEFGAKTHTIPPSALGRLLEDQDQANETCSKLSRRLLLVFMS
jgi:hypothetical protein